MNGYSIKGTRCYAKRDWGAKGRINVIGALFAGALLVTSLFQSTVNTNVFTKWVGSDLVQKLPPESIVVMDNASFHKGKDMQKMIEGNGHTLLYLPTYSPDLNPIEKKWAKAKAIRRCVQCSIEELFTEYEI